jgi:dihydropteroate synthase
MGILNVTPDSFSDGGRFVSVDAAMDRARQIAGEGASVIDVGGESTRPGADEVDVDVEIARTAPVIERIASLGVPVSIDTRKAAVAKAALDAGASVINDVSGGMFDPAMLPLAADRGVPVILMHTRGTPKTMDSLTDYVDVVADVREELSDRVAAAKLNGVRDVDILVDPGLGFAKTAEQSRELLRRIGEIRADGYFVAVGPSRKRFLGGELEDRLPATLGAVAWCAMHGVDLVRVHDVKEAYGVIDTIRSIAG